MKKLIWGRNGLFTGKNARAAAIKWASEGDGRVAYFRGGNGCISSTDGRNVCDGWSTGEDQGGNWWSTKETVKERMARM